MNNTKNKNEPGRSLDYLDLQILGLEYKNANVKYALT
jgi:hypothetical protein